MKRINKIYRQILLFYIKKKHLLPSTCQGSLCLAESKAFKADFFNIKKQNLILKD
jgi:hypothetical protein